MVLLSPYQLLALPFIALSCPAIAREDEFKSDTSSNHERSKPTGALALVQKGLRPHPLVTHDKIAASGSFSSAQDVADMEIWGQEFQEPLLSFTYSKLVLDQPVVLLGSRDSTVSVDGIGKNAIIVRLAAGIVACLPLGMIYLVHLWRTHGLFSHLRKGLKWPGTAQGALALAVYLTMLVSMDMLIKYEAEQGGGHYKTSPVVMVPLVEFGKLIMSVILYTLFKYVLVSKPEELSHLSPFSANARVDASQSSWTGALMVGYQMLPVALIYNFNNLLVFAVLAQVKLDAYAVWRNSAILFNAILWVWVLQRPLSCHKWIAINVCLAACCLNSMQLDGNFSFGLPVAGVLLSAFNSSIASVLNEYVLKARAASSLELDQVNLILYSETLILMAVGYAVWFLFDVVRTHPEEETLYAHLAAPVTAGAWRIIGMQVLLGLSVSRVLKYADAVAKTVVGSMRDVVLVFLAPSVVSMSSTRFDWVSVGSVCWVAVSGLIYFTPIAQAPSSSTMDVALAGKKSAVEGDAGKGPNVSEVRMR